MAFITGWPGGYCLVALLLAPYLRKFGQFTIPDFLGARFEGHLPRIMLAGLGTTFYYMLTTQPWLYKLTHGGMAITPEIIKANNWWDIAPISAGLFGVPLGFAVIIIVSLLTKAPGKEIQGSATLVAQESVAFRRGKCVICQTIMDALLTRFSITYTLCF